MWKGIIDHYREFLPVSDRTPIVTLNEGNTPLIFGKNISSRLDGKFKLFFKFEGANPTGSFKDRGMTLAISKALEEGSKAVICASTGNTSAAAAAFAAQAGMKCMVLIPNGSIALGKLAQALIHGTIVLAVDGSFDDALRVVKEVTQKYPLTLVNSINPYRLEGQKTAAFEICDSLEGRAPDFHFIPVGNAGNISAYWQGYSEYFKLKKSDRLPRMMGFQAAGAAPIVEGHVIEKPETIATAIRIGNPANWQKALSTKEESKGLIDKVTDQEILEAYQILAHDEGIFCEPASATSLAGFLKLHHQNFFEDRKKEETLITLTLTGHGLKDPDRAIKTAGEPHVIKPRMEEVIKWM
ncbi:MAG: threonine synthase [Chlamydiae bacterium]|nr:threonine synthase [Chlamydiota bacterium]MBI3277488.1 threonine synthase [Chlamydiota bacterium]